MSKIKWYSKAIYPLIALALVLSPGIVALPEAGAVGAFRHPEAKWLHFPRVPAKVASHPAFWS